jgi:pre-rRNA-processing protein TSR3
MSKRILDQNTKAKIYTYLMKQDDPKKCTSSKLVKFKLAKPLYRTSQIKKKMIILNPFAKNILSKLDRDAIQKYGIVVIDCSWEKGTLVLNEKYLRGQNRRLPLLLAANPNNYGKIGKLSSVEALCSALFITNFIPQAFQIISIFKWGKSFTTLNASPLEEYRLAENYGDMSRIEKEFF